jgi:hypothetical protein
MNGIDTSVDVVLLELTKRFSPEHREKIEQMVTAAAKHIKEWQPELSTTIRSNATFGEVTLPFDQAQMALDDLYIDAYYKVALACDFPSENERYRHQDLRRHCLTEHRKDLIDLASNPYKSVTSGRLKALAPHADTISLKKLQNRAIRELKQVELVLKLEDTIQPLHTLDIKDCLRVYRKEERADLFDRLEEGLSPYVGAVRASVIVTRARHFMGKS